MIMFPADLLFRQVTSLEDVSRGSGRDGVTGGGIDQKDRGPVLARSVSVIPGRALSCAVLRDQTDRRGLGVEEPAHYLRSLSSSRPALCTR